MAILVVAQFVVIWSPTAFVLIAAIILTLLSSGDYRRPRVTLSGTADMPRLLGRLAIPVLLVAVDATVQRVRSLGVRLRDRRRGRRGRDAVRELRVIRELRVHHVTRQRVGHRRGRCGWGAASSTTCRPMPSSASIRSASSIAPSPRPATRSSDASATSPRSCAATGARYVILAFGSTSDTDTVEVLRSLPPSTSRSHRPPAFEAGAAAGDPLVDDVWGVPLIWLRRRLAQQ